jgi:5-methylcytosine-specific restriction endonuclease McrA
MIDLATTKVLELNKNWLPLGTITLYDALTAVANTHDNGQPKAKIIHPEELRPMTWDDWSALKPKDGHDVIRSAHLVLRVPEIIMWTKFDKSRQPRNVFSRRTLYKRDGFKCQYCGCRPGSEELTIDHVVPKSHGGPTTWENCVLACVACNSFKANRTPHQAHMKLLSVPTKPKYALLKCEHIRVKSWEQFLGEAYWNVGLED